MSLLDRIKNTASKLRPAPSTDRAGRGILLFEHTGDVIKAEEILKKAGLKISVKAPPPLLRTGCDMVVEIPLVHGPSILNMLGNARINPLQMVPVSDELMEPVSIYQHTDFGKYLMVRAANMKITVEKSSGLIVNVSGGGCPDVPYLASILTGKTLQDAAPPLEQGQTLCGYALQLAFDEAKKCLG